MNQWEFQNALAFFTLITVQKFDTAHEKLVALLSGYETIWVFHKYTTLAITPILASEVLLRENKKSGNKMLPLVGIEPLA